MPVTCNTLSSQLNNVSYVANQVSGTRLPQEPQAAHRAETIALLSVHCIARCFISDIVEILIIEPYLMINLRNVSLRLPLFLLPDGNQNKDCCVHSQDKA
jgi:hypothetical protein